MWYFSSPQIVFGEDALDELERLQGNRALIVTDATIRALGMVTDVQRRLEQAGMEVTVFDRVEPEPCLETARQGAKLALEFRPDWIVGLGGGSPLDAAKMIWVLYERPDLQPEQINPLIPLGLRKKARLVAIPTTSGTGSEATWGIVLTDSTSRRKLGLGNRENLPDLAILDPALALRMPPQLTADTGLDALTHAIEGYTCTWHNDLSDGMCLTATRLVFAYLPRAVADGGDAEARLHMHNAAACAGLGFGNAMASLAHAMGHPLGATFHLPHGRAVGICLPYTIEYAVAVAPERFAGLARITGIAAQDDPTAGRQLAGALRNLCRQIGIPDSLAGTGLPRHEFETQLEKLVDDACNDTQMLTAPRCPSYEDLRRLFVDVYEGNEVEY